MRAFPIHNHIAKKLNTNPEASFVKIYKASHVVVDHGWVELLVWRSTTLPNCPATSAKFPSAYAERAGWGRHCVEILQIQVNLTPFYEHKGRPIFEVR